VFRKREWILLAALLVAYNINLRQVSSHDTYASRFVPISILRDGDLILDEFVPEEMKRRAGDDFFSDYFVYVRGHFYDSHPPIGPVLALPVYALPAWIGIPRRPELIANMFSKLAASIMAALSAMLIFRASRRLLSALEIAPAPRGAAAADRSERLAMLAAVAYGLGTSIWSTASLAMWTHTPAILGFSAVLAALTIGRPGVAGLVAAGAVFARPATAPAMALIGLYLVHRLVRGAGDAGWRSAEAASLQKDVLRFAAAGALAGLAGIAYNYWLFGNAVGGAPFRTGFWVKELGTTGMFEGSLRVGLAGLTFSPNRGILIYTPVVVVAVVGAVRAWRLRLPAPARDPSFGRADAILLTRYVSLASIAILLTYSKFIAWWGGHGYGPRYLTDAMPFVGLLLAVGFASVTVSRRAMSTIAAGVLLTYSVAIQAVGAFCWPSAWTLDDPPYRFRLWDWKETEIEVCLKNGPRVDPAARQLFHRLGF
jgi:hypothetical protein